MPVLEAAAESAGRKPRVLFIASSFPPANRPGSPRTSNIAGALVRLGWDVTVLSVEASQWVRQERNADPGDAGIRRIAVRNPWPALTGGLLHTKAPRLMQRVLRKIAVTLQIDPEIGWTRAAERTSLRSEDFDLIYVSAPPFAALPLAKRIADRLRRPYVVDYRDLWTFNPMLKRHPAARHKRADAAVLAGAAAVTVVSPSLAELLREHSAAADKIHVVPNGYRREALQNVMPTQFDHFAIVYAGVFYLPKRSIRPLFDALVLLERQQRLTVPWKFHYFGTQGSYVAATASAAGLPDSRLEIHGVVSRAEALAATAGASLVSVITTVDAEGSLADRGVVTGKIFEAIGLDRPMLVNAPRGSDVEHIVATAGRGRVIQGTDINAMADYIAAVANGESVARGSDPEAYEWTQVGFRLGGILRRVMEEQLA